MLQRVRSRLAQSLKFRKRSTGYRRKKSQRCRRGCNRKTSQCFRKVKKRLYSHRSTKRQLRLMRAKAFLSSASARKYVDGRTTFYESEYRAGDHHEKWQTGVRDSPD